MTIREFIAYLESLPEETKDKTLHCAELGGYPAPDELRVVSYYGNDGAVCINE